MNNQKSYPYIGKSEVSGSVVLLTSVGCGIFIESSNEEDRLRYSKTLHESYLTDITADYLRNTKIKIESPEHSEFVQNLVFGAGCAMAFSDENIGDYKFLFINSLLNMVGSDDKNYFALNKDKKIFLPLPPKEDGEMFGNTAKLLNESLSEKPIYTKEMHERGELPPVGSEVLIPHAGSERHEVVVGTPDKDNMIISMCNGYYRRINVDDIRPLPSPVDELDRELDRFFELNSIEDLAKAIINGDIDGLTYNQSS